MRRFYPVLKTAAIAAVVFVVIQRVQGGGISLPAMPKINVGA